MTKEDFLDFEIFITKKIATRRPVKGKAFQKASQIILRHDYPQSYLLKKDYNLPDSAGEQINVVPYRVSVDSFDLSSVDLPLKYPQGRQIDEKKLKDIQDLMKFMTESETVWIKDLVEQQNNLYGPVVAGMAEVQDDNEEIEDQDDHDLERVLDYDSCVRPINNP